MASENRPPAGAISYRWYRCSRRTAPRGGLGDLVQTFSSEEMAHRAFRDLRLKESSATSWAQLAVVDREMASDRSAGSGSAPRRPAPVGEAHPAHPADVRAASR